MVNEKRIIFCLMFAFALVISLMVSVDAWSINQFNNSLTEENLTYTSSDVFYRYLQVPEDTFVTNAYMNFSGMSNLVAYYSLEETTGTVEVDSMDNYNMTMIGTVQQGVTGKIDDAYNFTNIGYLNNSDYNDFNFLKDNFTISFWIKLNNAGVSTSQIILSALDENDGGIEISWEELLGKYRIYYKIKESAGSYVSLQNPATNIINNSNFYLITFRKEGSYMDYFINDTILNNRNDAYEFEDLVEFKIGNSLNGVIDEVSIWNRALTSGEISNLYNSSYGKSFSDVNKYPTNTTLGILDSLNTLKGIASNGRLIDFDDDTYANYFSSGVTSGYAYINFSTSSQYANNLTTIWYEEPETTVYSYCWNYTSSSWYTLGQLNTFPKYQTIPNTCFNGGINPMIRYKFSPYAGSTPKVYESSINGTYNGTSIWSYTSELTSNEQTNQFYDYINEYLDTCSYVSGYCYVPLSFYSATPGILEYLNLNFDNYHFIENSQTYNSEASSGISENYQINLSYDSTNYNILVYLNYNETNYTTTQIGSGDTVIFSTDKVTLIVATATNQTFYWIIILTNSTNSYLYTTDEINQTINTFLVDDCSVYTHELINMTMLDEKTLNEINGTIEIQIFFYTYGTSSLVSTYNNSFDYIIDTPSRICLDVLNDTYSMSYTIKHYGNSSYFEKFRNIQKMTINNETETQLLNLYNLETSLGYSFEIILLGNIYTTNGNSNLLVDVQKQYIPTANFISVESPLTSSEGIAIAKLEENDKVYNFIVSYNGVVIGTFNNYQVKCQNPSVYQCSINLNLAQATADLPDFENYGSISQIFLLENNILYHTFTSTDGETHFVVSSEFKHDGYGNTTICNNSVLGTSGTLTCPIPLIYQNTSFYVQTFVDGVYIGTKYFSLGTTPNWQGVDLFIELMMFSAIVLLFISHPITLVFGTILGFVSPLLLIYFASGSLTSIAGALIYYVALGILILVLIRRKI